MNIYTCSYTTYEQRDELMHRMSSRGTSSGRIQKNGIGCPLLPTPTAPSRLYVLQPTWGDRSTGRPPVNFVSRVLSFVAGVEEFIA